MCLALPARVIAVDDEAHATVDLGGVRRKVNVMLVEKVRPDDYVLLHVGFAIAKLDQQAAEQTLRLLDQAASTPHEPR